MTLTHFRVDLARLTGELERCFPPDHFVSPRRLGEGNDLFIRKH